MRFIGLNGREYNKSLDEFRFGIKEKSRSKPQAALGKILEELFPLNVILEEMTCFGTRLKLDFFLPELKIAFEYDGEQHDEYNPFFHQGKKAKFAQQQLNDVRKHEWCELNSIMLIRLTNLDDVASDMRKQINEQRD